MTKNNFHKNSILFTPNKEIFCGFLSKHDDLNNPCFQGYQIIRFNQVHKNDIYILRNQEDLTKIKDHHPMLQYDGGITNLQGCLIEIRTADCVPVLFYDKTSRLVGALHCGWRSLAAGIIEKSLNLLKKDFKTNLKNLFFLIGPAICKNCYEVGEDLVEKFIKKDFIYQSYKNEIFYPTKKNKFLADLKKITQLTLTNNKINIESIWKSNICTFCSQDFYSHRENKTIKRNINFVVCRH